MIYWLILKCTFRENMLSDLPVWEEYDKCREQCHDWEWAHGNVPAHAREDLLGHFTRPDAGCEVGPLITGKTTAEPRTVLTAHFTCSR